MAQVSSLLTAKDHLEESIKVYQEKLEIVSVDHENQAALWRKERNELQNKVSELLAHSEKGKHDKERQLEKNRAKATEYKQKLRLALQNV